MHDGSIHCCSKECSIELRKIRMSGENNHQYGLKGALNSSYKGGEKINVGGYILIYSPGTLLEIVMIMFWNTDWLQKNIC